MAEILTFHDFLDLFKINPPKLAQLTQEAYEYYLLDKANQEEWDQWVAEGSEEGEYEPDYGGWREERIAGFLRLLTGC